MKVTQNTVQVLPPPPTYTILLSQKEALVVSCLLGGLTDGVAEQLVEAGKQNKVVITKEYIKTVTDELYNKLANYLNY